MDYEKELKKYKKEYIQLYDRLEDEVLLQNKRLDNTLISQLNIQLDWVKLSAKISWLFKNAELETEEYFAIAYTDVMSNSAKILSATEARQYANCDNTYIKSKQFENDVYKLKKEVDGVVDIIETRKYIVKDLTAAIINDVSKTILS